MTSKISIIIPVFNGEEHISQCVQTLQNQIYNNWEAIFVNDGSNDNTIKYLNYYANQDNRIFIYSQSNQGAAKAREYGLSKITGDYITFLDIDDTLTNEALDIMLKSFDKETDIVVTGLNIIKNGKLVKYKNIYPEKIERIEYLKKVLCGKYGLELCGKLYRIELFKTPLYIPFNIRSGEDAVVFIQLVCRSRKMKILPERVYNYIQYKKSASHTKSKKYAEETLLSAFLIEKIIKRYPFYKNVKSEINAMFLLFYSNSTRKAILYYKNPLIKSLITSHWKTSALCKIPFYKAIYICISYLIGYFMIQKH